MLRAPFRSSLDLIIDRISRPHTVMLPCAIHSHWPLGKNSLRSIVLDRRQYRFYHQFDHKYSYNHTNDDADCIKIIMDIHKISTTIRIHRTFAQKSGRTRRQTEIYFTCCFCVSSSKHTKWRDISVKSWSHDHIREPGSLAHILMTSKQCLYTGEPTTWLGPRMFWISARSKT